MLTLFLAAFSPAVNAQFWTEDFGNDFANCISQGGQVGTFVGANGAWSQIESGPNGPVANEWYVSAAEGGFPVGSCNAGCIADFVLNRTLHLGSNLDLGAGDEGAIYSEVGAINVFNTDRRASSPVIDCSGEFGIDMTFRYINTASATDFCTVDYFDGTVWQTLLNLPNSPNTCAPPLRTWAQTTVALPATANNNPNVRIGFRWRNNDDGFTNGGNEGHSVAQPKE